MYKYPWLALAVVFVLATIPAYAQEVKQALTNASCLECHSEASGLFNPDIFKESAHQALNCTDCHNDITGLPHDTPLAKAACATCHEDVNKEFQQSIHFELAQQGKLDLPSCRDCHGAHDIFARSDPRSRVNHLKIDQECFNCHTDPKVLQKHPDMPTSEFIRKYTNSVHGKGVHLKGLVVSATCTDCHGAHKIRPLSDPASHVSKMNVPLTCKKCHEGIFDEYALSIHGKLWTSGRPDPPVCTSCHAEHGIEQTQSMITQMDIPRQCGHCHSDKINTYADTFHGQASSLGFLQAAKCADCHTAHSVLAESDPASSINTKNLVATCGKCHKESSERFVKYDPHVDVHSKERSPMIFYTYQFMRWLLISVFLFWGLHTFFWFQRSLVAIIRREFTIEKDQKQYIRRFSDLQRYLHAIVVISFIGLVMTGLPLKYYYAPWAQHLSAMIGGVEIARFFHRVFGFVTIGYFIFHLLNLSWQLIAKRDMSILIGPESLMPNKKDFVDLLANFKWFFYKGERPRYDRWTYFEKFDYFAVFWGVCVIGFSGIMLWFPGFFTQFLPGDFLNMAHIIHSDEALLALAFIFIVHFFHNHMRVENFPIDLVIFSGVLPLERYMKERPAEYERRVREGKLQQMLVPPPPLKTTIKCMIFGFSTLGLGLAVIIAILTTFFMMPK